MVDSFNQTLDMVGQEEEEEFGRDEGSQTMLSESVTLAFAILANRLLHGEYTFLTISLLLSSMSSTSLARAAAWRATMARHSAKRILRMVGAGRSTVADILKPVVMPNSVVEAVEAIAKVDQWLLESCREVKNDSERKVGLAPLALINSLITEQEELNRDSAKMINSGLTNV